jgi:hypothetical protein
MTLVRQQIENLHRLPIFEFSPTFRKPFQILLPLASISQTFTNGHGEIQSSGT